MERGGGRGGRGGKKKLECMRSLVRRSSESTSHREQEQCFSFFVS